MQNRALLAKIENNREEADLISATDAKWRSLEPAITPARTPVEIFHQLSLLVPERGFRITSFEYLQSKSVVVRGEAEEIGVSFDFGEALMACKELKDYKWEVQPQEKGEIASFYGIGTYIYDQGVPGQMP